MAYRPGDYLTICDRCGFRRLASECRLEWNGSFVCADTCWEPKHPQYTPPRPEHEKQTVPIHRPEKTDVFVTDANDGDAWDAKTDAITGDDL